MVGIFPGHSLDLSNAPSLPVRLFVNPLTNVNSRRGQPKRMYITQRAVHHATRLVTLFANVHVINKMMHRCLWIWTIFSRVQLSIFRYELEHSKNIPYLRALFYYPLYILEELSYRNDFLFVFFRSCHGTNIFKELNKVGQ